MKKLLITALIGLAAVGAFAALDTAQTYHDVMIPATTPGYTITGSSVDTINYKGFGTVVISVGETINTNAVTSFTNIVSLQKAAASTGTWSTFTAVTNTYSTNPVTWKAEVSVEFGKGDRYWRAIVTNKNDAVPVAVWINAPK